ncbi:MAG: MFS transporter [Armatimonadetes bacterium]|nr:MFS transporter [Armatimonadota bacterium]
MAEPAEHGSTEPPAPLSTTVRTLGLVSLFTDVSSEMVYPVNPVFLTRVLGAPAWVLGLVEGAAEATASLLKLYSGAKSDRLGARKPLTVLGYSMAAVSKPIIGLAGPWGAMFAARLLDRAGKGIRSAPRDALIAEASTPDQRGRAFGLHRSLDTAGAVLGPLCGYAFLRAYPDAFRSLYFLAFIPALIGVLLLVLFVRERAKKPGENPPAEPKKAFTWAGLDPSYKRFLLVLTIFSIGNSSDAFLLLRAQGNGFAAESLLLLYAFFNVVEACLGYAVGSLSDRVGRRPMIAFGYATFAIVYLGFAWMPSPIAVWPLFVVYGLYYTCTQGVQRAFAADLAHPDRRGAELGAFHMLVGLAALPASLLAGFLYAKVAPAAPFYLGAATSLAAALMLIGWNRWERPASLEPSA